MCMIVCAWGGEEVGAMTEVTGATSLPSRSSCFHACAARTRLCESGVCVRVCLCVCSDMSVLRTRLFFPVSAVLGKLACWAIS